VDVSSKHLGKNRRKRKNKNPEKSVGVKLDHEKRESELGAEWQRKTPETPSK